MDLPLATEDVVATSNTWPTLTDPGVQASEGFLCPSSDPSSSLESDGQASKIFTRSSGLHVLLTGKAASSAHITPRPSPVNVSLTSNLQRHILLSTSTASSAASAVQIPPKTPDHLMATDPRNILMQHCVSVPSAPHANPDAIIATMPTAYEGGNATQPPLVDLLPKHPLGSFDMTVNLTPDELISANDSPLELPPLSNSVLSLISPQSSLPPPTGTTPQHPHGRLRPVASEDLIRLPHSYAGHNLTLCSSTPAGPLSSTEVSDLPRVVTPMSHRVVPMTTAVNSNLRLINEAPVHLMPSNIGQIATPASAHVRLVPQHLPNRTQKILRESPSIATEKTLVLADTLKEGPKGGNIHPKIEPISCFKCSFCGFLALSVRNVEEHMLLEHKQDKSENWLQVAQREGITLDCPLCDNKFRAEGQRSFKVHVVDDHSLTEEEAEASYKERTEQRRNKVVELLAERKKQEKLRSQSKMKEAQSLEAYVDASGELRVRCTSDGKDMTATEFVENRSSKKALSTADDESEVVAEPKRKKERPPGRPKGSKTVGITKLRKKANMNSLELSEAKMGPECQVENCAVRLKSESLMDVHRRCHAAGGGGYRCCECQEEMTTWPKMALHLWRKHKIDMELFACSKCDSFRSFTRTKLGVHLLTHDNDKQFLCDDCGKGFKTEKNLSVHQRGIHRRVAKKESKGGACHICDRKFKEGRMLKLHVSSVHHKIKPHLCNYCGYSAANKSTLRLHLRRHTGERPYGCDLCDYRTSDHNSLRRHRMTHSGDKQYKCPYCSYSSIQCSTFKLHLKNKHPDGAKKIVFNCSECLFKTVREETFRAHLAQHKLKKEPKTEDACNA